MPNGVKHRFKEIPTHASPPLPQYSSEVGLYINKAAGTLCTSAPTLQYCNTCTYMNSLTFMYKCTFAALPSLLLPCSSASCPHCYQTSCMLAHAHVCTPLSFPPTFPFCLCINYRLLMQNVDCRLFTTGSSLKAVTTTGNCSTKPRGTCTCLYTHITILKCGCTSTQCTCCFINVKPHLTAVLGGEAWVGISLNLCSTPLGICSLL